jgi:hypothetical protein
MCCSLTDYSRIIYLNLARDAIGIAGRRAKGLRACLGVLSSATLCHIVVFPLSAAAQTIIIDTSKYTWLAFLNNLF